MKHITILYPEGLRSLSTIACIVGAVEVFTRANAYWTQLGNPERYEIIVAGVSQDEDFVSGLVAIKTGARLSDIERTNLIIIPSALTGEVTAKTQQMFDWIRKQYKLGAEVASMCSGAFILAATGIIDGKNCSTHWSLANAFRNQFPNVTLQSDKLITDENGIYTNGGAYSFLNLVLYLVEKYYDRPTAIYCSKIFQIELDRNSQSAFAIFTGQKMHDDDMVQQVQAYIENHVEDKISVADLSVKFASGRRNLDRRFIKATGNTPMEYAQRVKIESAKKALETSRKTVNEVMYDVGYSDIKAFREVFRKITGMSPIEYKGKYNKDFN